MAVQFRAASQANSQDTGVGGGPTISRPAGTQTGDLLICVIIQDRDAGANALSTPTGWTKVSSSSPPTSSPGWVHVYTKTAQAGDPASWQFVNSSSGQPDITAGMIAVFGHDPTTPLASGPTWQYSSANGTTHTAPSVTGVVDGLLVCAFGRSDSGSATATFTLTASLTERVDHSGTSSWTSLAIGTQSLAAAGATGTRTATCSDSAQWTGMSLVVDAAPTSTTWSSPLDATASATVTDVVGHTVLVTENITAAASASVTATPLVTHPFGAATTAAATASISPLLTRTSAVSATAAGSASITPLVTRTKAVGATAAASAVLSGTFLSRTATLTATAAAAPTVTAPTLDDLAATGRASAAITPLVTHPAPVAASAAASATVTGAKSTGSTPAATAAATAALTPLVTKPSVATASAATSATVAGLLTITPALAATAAASAVMVSGPVAPVTATAAGSASLGVLVTHPVPVAATAAATATLAGLLTRAFALSASATTSTSLVGTGTHPAPLSASAAATAAALGTVIRLIPALLTATAQASVFAGGETPYFPICPATAELVASAVEAVIAVHRITVDVQFAPVLATLVATAVTAELDFKPGATRSLDAIVAPHRVAGVLAEGVVEAAVTACP